jgi:hypothetical protein
VKIPSAASIGLFVVLVSVVSAPASAQKISFSHELASPARRCLSQLLENGRWRRSPQFHQEMQSVAVVAQTRLGMNDRVQYFYIMDRSEFCGTAGCSMLIGEDQGNGSCRELFDGSGFTHAIAVLNARDHGYRRLYTPCELRFNGHQYQQLHEECPTLDVQR